MSSTSLVPFQAKKKPITQPAIDNYTEIIPPLDYSFCRIEKIHEAMDEEPRLPVSPRNKGKQRKPEPAEEGTKYPGRCIKMNNNNITNLEGFPLFITEKFMNMELIGWIDLSHNELVKLGSELTEFVNLQILYLHGNHIADITEVRLLSPLTRLDKLTLHGNPMETTRNYRSIVISELPQLKSLDFSRITKADRRTASVLGNTGEGKKKKKMVEDED